MFGTAVLSTSPTTSAPASPKIYMTPSQNAEQTTLHIKDYNDIIMYVVPYLWWEFLVYENSLLADIRLQHLHFVNVLNIILILYIYYIIYNMHIYIYITYLYQEHT